eukprot:155835-Rhodomonas_salina.2
MFVARVLSSSGIVLRYAYPGTIPGFPGSQWSLHVVHNITISITDSSITNITSTNTIISVTAATGSESIQA